MPPDTLRWPVSSVPPPLSAGQAHLWRIDLLESLPPVELVQALSAAEREHAERFYFERDRRRFIVSHAALRAILAAYLQLEPGEMIYTFGPSGKPAVDPARHGRSLAFNLAHSEELALVALAEAQDVGVDIEYIRPLEKLDELARYNLTAGEWAAFETLPAWQKSRAFFRTWAGKEAYIKALGRGLSLPLNTFALSEKPDLPGACTVLEANSGLPVAGWTIWEVEVRDGYAAALAIPDSICDFQGWSYSSKQG